MARINLLPWREELRERKNKEFITLVFAITLLALIAAFAVWSYFNNQLEEQRNANALIEQRNAQLDGALAEIADLEQRREDIIARMQVIQDLQGRRPVPVHVWDDIPKAVPPAMYINKLERKDDTITITGLADNPNVVSSLIRNLDASDWMGNSAVSNIQRDISAYQQPAALSNRNNGTNSQAGRPEYPEDSYVQFVVTTQVQSSHKSGEQDSESTDTATNTGDAS